MNIIYGNVVWINVCSRMLITLEWNNVCKLFKISLKEFLIKKKIDRCQTIQELRRNLLSVLTVTAIRTYTVFLA